MTTQVSADGDFVLDVTHASHCYGGVVALNDVSLAVKPGEFVTLLGPSGSGKTTLLRIIAGLEHPTSIERLSLAGRDMRGVPAEQRNVVTVFQHFALFPHMSVRENVEYGLRVRGRPAGERRKKAGGG
jgi:ABC-type Fe3+/spermidine/putrescine transport system ATPase subunit